MNCSPDGKCRIEEPRGRPLNDRQNVLVLLHQDHYGIGKFDAPVERDVFDVVWAIGKWVKDDDTSFETEKFADDM